MAPIDKNVLNMFDMTLWSRIAVPFTSRLAIPASLFWVVVLSRKSTCAYYLLWSGQLPSYSHTFSFARQVVSIVFDVFVVSPVVRRVCFESFVVGCVSVYSAGINFLVIPWLAFLFA